jgi:tRNA(Ile)-lysidine synthase
VPTRSDSEQDAGARLSSQLQRRFHATLQRETKSLAGQVVLVGLSGGADSSALLLLLEHFSRALGYHCEAAYFDHEIRGTGERATELRAVQRLAEALGVALQLGGAPVAANARLHQRSLEEQARLERYDFLGRVAADHGAAFVAVGHTADDLAETILLNIIRGTGLRGVAGMAPSQPWPYGPGPQLLRPLLGFRHTETVAYCFCRGVVPHEDSENLSPRYRRNQIRLSLMPLMQQLNPRIVDALIRLGGIAEEQLRLLSGLAAEASGSEEANLLKGLPPSVRNEVLAEGYSGAAGSRRELSARHLSALNALIKTSGEHTLDLPGGVEARLRGGRLTFGSKPAGSGEPRRHNLGANPLSVPGSMEFGDWEICSEVIPTGAIREPGRLTAVIMAKDAREELLVRARLAGDRMQPAGMAGHKKLQDIFVDAKIPRSQRTRLPLLCIGEEIVWVPGVGASARATVRDTDTKRIAISARLLDVGNEAGIG